MGELNRHPSEFALDRFAAGALPDPAAVSAHLEGCPECRQRLETRTSADEGFLARYPTVEALAGRHPRPSRPASARPPRWLVLRLSLGGAIVAAAAVLLVVFPRPGGAPTVHDPRAGLEPRGGAALERVKGDSIVELAVRRGTQSFRFDGQPLRTGDLIALRYSTERRFLLLLTVEASGKISQLVPASGGASQAIQPGRKVLLAQGLRLDAYPGSERLVALLSDRPLPASEVQRSLADQIRRLSPARRAELPLERLPFPAEQQSWLLRKGAP